MDQLSLIRRPIEADLERYLALFEQEFKHQNPLLQLALQHILKRQGKRLRPILTLLAANCFGRVGEAVLHASVSLELLHTATLVHDDIVDESDMRRGQASVNSLLSPQAAVLVGDYLLAKSLQHSALTQNVDVVHRIAQIAEQLSDGELLQLYTLDSDDISEEAYYDVIRCKTASLFSACSQLGAMLAKADDNQIEALRLFGEYLGIAFQIRDDMLDYTSTANIGKPAGNDMKEGKLTLPVIYVVNKLSAADSASSCVDGSLDASSSTSLNGTSIKELALKVRHNEATDAEIAQLVELTVGEGGLEYASQCMNRFADQALEQLNVLPQSEYVDSLRAFANLVVKRDK